MIALCCHFTHLFIKSFKMTIAAVHYMARPRLINTFSACVVLKFWISSTSYLNNSIMVRIKSIHHP